jgi:hypothetical protein
MTVNFSPCSVLEFYRQANARNTENPANSGVFAPLDRRAWEIVEFPVDGESRTERSLEIFKSGLHGGKNPTECVPIHLGVSREYIGKSHNREPRPVFHSLTDALLTTRL